MHDAMTLKQYYKKYSSDIDKAISSALVEDKVYNDITTNILLKGKNGRRKISAVLLCKEDCIASGLEIFKRVYRKIDPRCKFKLNYKDGDFVRNKQKVLEVQSSLQNLLIGERISLNFVQRMSGIATLTNYFVKKLRFKGAKILHTRKTTPNFRVFEIAAVKTGGGDFYRFSLASSVMVKDNHIAASGSIENVLKILHRKKNIPSKTVIEVKNFNELKQVLDNGKGIINTVMLDNFKQTELYKAIKMLKEKRFKVEISGGINMKNFLSKQRKGIDFYSIGMLTHSYKSVDFSLEF